MGEPVEHRSNAARRTIPVGRTKMQIHVNGDPHQVPDGTTVAELLERLGLAGKLVAVEVNLQVVPRQQHTTHRLAEGDRLEIVTLVGGG